MTDGAAPPRVKRGRKLEPDVFLTIRVPAELRDAINALAEQNERTQAAEIRVALKQHVQDSPTR